VRIRATETSLSAFGGEGETRQSLRGARPNRKGETARFAITLGRLLEVHGNVNPREIIITLTGTKFGL